MFHYYLEHWELAQDGDPIFTPTSRLLPVHYASGPAMLKIAVSEEERRGGQLMQWWDGQGAARVLAYDDRAVLLEGAISLADMVSRSRDEEASRTICAVLAKLHRPRSQLPPMLVVPQRVVSAP
jgi:streptomycin 6-kinase